MAHQSRHVRSPTTAGMNGSYLIFCRVRRVLLPMHRPAAFQLVVRSRPLRRSHRHPYRRCPTACIVMSACQGVDGVALLSACTLVSVVAPDSTCIISRLGGLLRLSRPFDAKLHLQAIVAREPPAFQLRPNTVGRSGLDQQAAGSEGGKKVHPMQHVMIVSHQLACIISWHTIFSKVNAPCVSQTSS